MYSCGALATDMTRLGVLPPKALGTRDEAFLDRLCVRLWVTFLAGNCRFLFLFCSLLILVNFYGVPEVHKGERSRNFSTDQCMLYRLAVCTGFSWS